MIRGLHESILDENRITTRNLGTIFYEILVKSGMSTSCHETAKHLLFSNSQRNVPIAENADTSKVYVARSKAKSVDCRSRASQ